MASWLTHDEQTAWMGLLVMSEGLFAELNRRLQAEHNLSTADYDVLSRLSQAPDDRLRGRDLADMLTWEQSRLSHQLGRMQRRGLIEKTQSPDDRRSYLFALTSAGRDALVAAAPGHVEAVRELFIDRLTREQIAQLTQIARAVTAPLRVEVDKVRESRAPAGSLRTTRT